MFRKILVPFLTLALLALGIGSASADVPASQTKFQITTTGPTLPILLQGGSACGVDISVLTSSPTFTIVPQASNDYPAVQPGTWSTATNIGSGSITSTGAVAPGLVSSTGLAAFRLNVTALAGGTIQAVVTCSGATIASTGTPPNGFGPYVPPAPAAGGTDFFDGDSITFGTGASSCSGTSSAPSGTCFADLVSIHDSAHEINKGVSGTCLEYTTTSGSPCNQVSSTTGSLIQRYASDFASLTAGMRVFIMIGTNDVYAYSHPDTSVSYATYRANLVTVTSAAAAIVGLSNVFLLEIPSSSPAGFFDPLVQALLNSAVADVSRQYGYNLAVTSTTQTACAVANPGDTTFCLAVDGIHPDTNGHNALATQIEAANFSNSLAAADANRKSYGVQNVIYGLNPLVSTNAFFPWGSGASNTAAGMTCIGVSACNANTSAPGQTFLGFQSGYHATSGTGQNSGVGYQSCYTLTTGKENVCFGYGSLAANISANNNSAVGYGALNAATAANGTAVGSTACFNITSGAGNTCLGQAAGQFFGTSFGSNVTSSQSVYVGNLSAAKANGDTQEVIVGANLVGLGSNSVAVGGGTAPGFYSGTGAPTFSAPNASIYLRYDGTPGSTIFYINTSGASTSGTTWTAKF